MASGTLPVQHHGAPRGWAIGTYCRGLSNKAKVYPRSSVSPGVTTDIVKIDWMHIVDLGIGADWLGQLFTTLRDKMGGPNQTERMRLLWQRVQDGYKTYPTETKLDNLTNKMLSPDAPSPKLRAHAAECRGLIPIVAHIAREVLSATDQIEATILDTTNELEACYNCLSDSTVFPLTFWPCIAIDFVHCGRHWRH